jgi:hypothetical protein
VGETLFAGLELLWLHANRKNENRMMNVDAALNLAIQEGISIVQPKNRQGLQCTSDAVG